MSEPNPYFMDISNILSSVARERDQALAALAASEARVKALERGLSPFADMGDEMESAIDLIDDPDRQNDVEIIFGGMLVAQSEIGDFLHARALLTPDQSFDVVPSEGV